MFYKRLEVDELMPDARSKTVTSQKNQVKAKEEDSLDKMLKDL